MDKLIVAIIVVVFIILLAVTVGLILYSSRSSEPAPAPDNVSTTLNQGSNTATGTTPGPAVTPDPSTGGSLPTTTTPSSPTTPTAPSTPTPVPDPAPTCSDPYAYYYYYAPDVKAAGVDGKLHWLSYGYREGRKSCWPAPNFDGGQLSTDGRNNTPVQLNQGEKINSPDGRWQLVMQADGNLVGYVNSTGKSFWRSGSTGRGTGPYRATLQGDGNFVVYDSANAAIWKTGKLGNLPPYTLNMQNDRNIVVYNGAGKAIWASGSNA